jgi:hypothetical protein
MVASKQLLANAEEGSKNVVPRCGGIVEIITCPELKIKSASRTPNAALQTTPRLIKAISYASYVQIIELDVIGLAYCHS